jgi:hypothetical protein
MSQYQRICPSCKGAVYDCSCYHKPRAIQICVFCGDKQDECVCEHILEADEVNNQKEVLQDE